MVKRAFVGILVFVVACSTGGNTDSSDCGSDGSNCQTQAADSCSDKKRDGDELGVDCGGSCAKKCDGAKGCSGNDQCASANCQGGTCGPSAGKTCGVGLPNACNDGDTCGQDADCVSDYCGADTKCAEPPPDAHMDGRRNAGETGVDCGGTVAATQPCAAGQPCKTSNDCVGACDTMMMLCQDPSPTDGKKDGDETDVDCGGATAPKCALTKACNANADCILDACTANACVVPTETDGIKNGSETDVDCGGAGVTDGTTSYKAPRCSFDKKCASGDDCMTGACSVLGTGTCTVPSCATGETAGVVTCGKGETGDAAAVHESCCRSLVMPTRTNRRLDKYEITAGRFRTFLSDPKASPNVRAWVADYVAKNPTSQLAQLVGLNAPVVGNIYPAVDRFDALSLTAHMSHDIDNYNGIRGCYTGYTTCNTTADCEAAAPGAGSTCVAVPTVPGTKACTVIGDASANTYWLDATHNADFGLPPRVTPRSVSDEKSLNCAMPIMFAAFCAWDGGELATFADYWDTWPNTAGYTVNVSTDNTFPWSSANVCPGSGGQGPNGSLPCGNYNWCNGTYKNGGFTCQNLAFSVNGEQGVFYEYPIGTERSWDNEPLIAAPGRFIGDSSQLTSGGEHWFDLWANMVEITGDFAASTSDFCDFSVTPLPGAQTCTRSNRAPGDVGTHYTNIPVAGLIGVSWEGHEYGRGVQKAWPVTAQYGKFGARCVRPANPY